MSEESQLLLCGKSVVPPEELDWDVTVEDTAQVAVFQSSAVDIRDSIGKSEFETTYLILKQDVLDQTIKRQRRFVMNCLEKIEEVYDFKFPFELDIITKQDVLEFLDFLEFLEYANEKFLASVWSMLKVDIWKTDIESFARNNEMKIISEVEEQIESNDYNEKISTFLRTYYKDKFIEWFVKNSIDNKLDILIEQKQIEKEI